MIIIKHFFLSDNMSSSMPEYHTVNDKYKVNKLYNMDNTFVKQMQKVFKAKRLKVISYILWHLYLYS